MSELTTSSMHDARDAEDQRLLEAGELTLLVESYYGVMLDRCRARVWPEADAVAVAAEVAIRLLSELKRRYGSDVGCTAPRPQSGRASGISARSELARASSDLAHYRVPFRVVVHKVIGWKINEHFEPAKVKEVELEEWLQEASTESQSELEPAAGFDALLEGLTELEQDVLRLRYADDLDFQEIAARLDKEPNAVHQIHHRALTKLRGAAA